MVKKWKSRVPIIEGYTTLTNIIEVKTIKDMLNPHKIDKFIYYVYPEGLSKDRGFKTEVPAELRLKWEEVLGKMIEKYDW